MASRSMDTNPFADYLWMGEMEKFDEEIEAQIENEFQEEEFIRSCIEQLLEEEEEQTVYFQSNNRSSLQEVPSDSNGYDNGLLNQMNSLYINPRQSIYHASTTSNGIQQFSSYSVEPSKPKSKPAPHVSVKKSTLNPNAASFVMNPKAKEFVPKFPTTNSISNHAIESGVLTEMPLVQHSVSSSS